MLLALVAATLFLRLLVPVGYMLGAVGGVPALVPCPQFDAASAPMPHHGHSHTPASHAEPQCPFAALSAPVLPPVDSPAIAQAAPSYDLPVEPLTVALLAPRPASPPPPATGPPAAA
jgi:hypothetical protein